MSDKPKFKWQEAALVAKEICARLKVATTKLVVAGSLRRLKPMVSDIEVLYMPIMRPSEIYVDFFDAPPLVSAVEPILDNMLRDGVIDKRPSVEGIYTWGPLNKLAIHKASGIPVDFFAEHCEDNWPRSLVIRTGPKEMNIRLIESAAKQGIRVHAYGAAMTKMTTGDTVPCKTEKEFFALCGVTYLDPDQRR